MVVLRARPAELPCPCNSGRGRRSSANSHLSLPGCQCGFCSSPMCIPTESAARGQARQQVGHSALGHTLGALRTLPAAVSSSVPADAANLGPAAADGRPRKCQASRTSATSAEHLTVGLHRPEASAVLTAPPGGRIRTACQPSVARPLPPPPPPPAATASSGCLQWSAGPGHHRTGLRQVKPLLLLAVAKMMTQGPSRPGPGHQSTSACPAPFLRLGSHIGAPAAAPHSSQGNQGNSQDAADTAARRGPLAPPGPLAGAARLVPAAHFNTRCPA